MSLLCLACRCLFTLIPPVSPDPPEHALVWRAGDTGLLNPSSSNIRKRNRWRPSLRASRGSGPSWRGPRNPLDQGTRQHSFCGPTHLRSLARDTYRDLTGGCVDAGPQGLPGGSQGPSPSSGRPRGVGAPAEAYDKEVLTVAIAEDLAVIHEPDVDEAFRLEQHGIDYIPESERWATPRDIFGMWAGASVQIEYFIYGAILMTFGFTFAQVLSSSSWATCPTSFSGCARSRGPTPAQRCSPSTGHSTGPTGPGPSPFSTGSPRSGSRSRASSSSWAPAGVDHQGRIRSREPGQGVLVIAAVLVQIVLPFLGHATIVKTLRLLIIPFAALFAVLLGFGIPHAHLDAVPTGPTGRPT